MDLNRVKSYYYGMISLKDKYNTACSARVRMGESAPLPIMAGVPDPICFAGVIRAKLGEGVESLWCVTVP